MTKEEKTQGDGVKLGQVVAGSLASITAAAVGSTMGVEGTLVGAGLASVVSTVGSTVYLRSLHHTRRRVRTVRERVVARAGGTDGVSVTVGARERNPRPRWQLVLGGSLLAFVIGMLAVTGLEWLSGKPLSGGTGTTIGRVVRSDDDDRHDGPGFLPPLPTTTSTPPTSTTGSSVAPSPTPSTSDGTDVDAPPPSVGPSTPPSTSAPQVVPPSVTEAPPATSAQPPPSN